MNSNANLTSRTFGNRTTHFDFALTTKPECSISNNRQDGAIYTFRERSSGLRYFLSYYIQAKAIEARAVKENRLGCVSTHGRTDFLFVNRGSEKSS